MKRLRKSNWLCLVFLIYVTVMAVYLLPRNTEISNTEKYVTVIVSYAIVGLLWLVLRKKEKLAEERKKEAEKTKNENNNSHKSDRK